MKRMWVTLIYKDNTIRRFVTEVSSTAPKGTWRNTVLMKLPNPGYNLPDLVQMEITPEDEIEFTGLIQNPDPNKVYESRPLQTSSAASSAPSTLNTPTASSTSSRGSAMQIPIGDTQVQIPAMTTPISPGPTGAKGTPKLYKRTPSGSALLPAKVVPNGGSSPPGTKAQSPRAKGTPSPPSRGQREVNVLPLSNYVLADIVGGKM